MKLRHFLLPALAAGALAAPTLAQFDSLTYKPDSPVIDEGFLVLHDDGNGVQAFSAFTQEWTSIASPGSPILGSGDWTALVEDVSGDLIAYTARAGSGQKLTLLPTDTLLEYYVEDDVILVLLDRAGVLTAGGYSAQTNAWDVLPLTQPTPVAGQYASSRFVLGVVDQTPGPDTLYGFSARQGVWTPAPLVGSFDDLQADGNVVATLFDDGTTRAVAFSGVHGQFAFSPATWPAATVLVDHNVAFVEQNAVAADWRGTVFSAYDVTWVPSPVAYFAGAMVTVHIEDNLVALEHEIAAGSLFEAIGARPHLGWAPQLGPGGLGTIGPDALVMVIPGPVPYALSGVADGTWQATAIAGGPVFSTGLDHLVHLRDAADFTHVFNPAMSVWGAPFNHNGPSPATPADAALMAEDGLSGTVTGYSPRFDTWVPGPAPAWPTTTQPLGSMTGMVVTAGPNVGRVHLWDTRLNQWAGPFDMGGPATAIGERNTVVVEGPTSVYAYSLQRMSWDEFVGPAGPVALPLTDGPHVEENVAWLVDANGDLVAYGSVNELHTWFQYPDGTEYHAWAVGGAPFPSTPLRFSARADAGDLVATFFDLTRLPVGVAPGGPIAGLLWLPTPTLLAVVGPLPSANLHGAQPLPPNPPLDVQGWWQGAVRTPGIVPPWTLTVAPDPFWIF